jgi:hypothetical protein
MPRVMGTVSTHEDGRRLSELARRAGIADLEYTVCRFNPTPIAQRRRPDGFLFVVDTLEYKSVWALNFILDGTDAETVVC